MLRRLTRNTGKVPLGRTGIMISRLGLETRCLASVDLLLLGWHDREPGGRALKAAERDVFPHLPANDAPGIVAFTCLRWGDFLNPKKMPEGEAPLSPADWFR